MKIAILGATGFVGAAILAEASARPDLAVTAIARNDGAIAAAPRVTPVGCDIADEARLAALLRGHDAVVHAYHPGRVFADGDLVALGTAGHRAILSSTRAAQLDRLVAVGGAGSLKTAEGVEYLDSSMWSKDFDPYRPAILATRALYHLLKDAPDLDWVFLCPSEMLRPGQRTTQFRYGRDDLLIDRDGKSHISLEDFAYAMVEEVVHPRFHRERVTVGY